MAEVMDIIKKEIGPDAIIMSSRQVKKRRGFLGLFSKKEFEVLAGYEEEDVQNKEPSFASAAKSAGVSASGKPGAKARAKSAYGAGGAGAGTAGQTAKAVPKQSSSAGILRPPQNTEELAASLQAMRAENQQTNALTQSINELKSIVEQMQVRSAVGDRTPDRRFSRDVLDIYRCMLASGVEENTAENLCARAEEVVQTRGAEAHDVVKNLILETLGKPHLVEPVKYQRKTVMLIGPTGVGKTTTLIKLAYMLLYQKNVNIGIINTDSFRVAAQEHMKSYCDILKTDMLNVYRPEEIGEALDAFRNKDVVLIDTAGKVSDDAEYREDIRKLLEIGGIDDVYITLSATTSERVLQQTLENYSFVNRYNIIVTKTDEAPAPGPFLYLASLSGRPLSYMTTGQAVPDDILPVSAETIADSILTPRAV